MNLLPVVFWGLLFCIGYLAGGLHSGVLALLWGLSTSLLSYMFGAVGFVIACILGVAFLLGGLKIALIGLVVVVSAYLFLSLLG